MQKKAQKFVIYGLAAAAVLVATGASAYYITQGKTAEPQLTSTAETTAAAPVYTSREPAPVATQAPACDDGNVVGLATGAVAGGLLGNQIGKGSGNTIATIGGAAGGAALGQRYIPTDGATCR